MGTGNVDLAQGNDGIVKTSATDLMAWGGILVGKNSLVGSRYREVEKSGGRNYKDGEVVWPLLSTIKSLEKEKAESDSQASESWLWRPGSRPRKGSRLLRSHAWRRKRRAGPGPSPGAAKFQSLNPRQVS